ncbi:MAG: NAD-dependent epimerase/dehydratase family protein, partial [Bacteroidales bacterium]|nr:NAD-dependent epimerase/dehydratase family protein [Bacteroidales bacterium]
MISVGITGQAGFIGTPLFNYLNLDSDHFSVIPFEDSIFEDSGLLNNWVSQCNVLVHLAAMNRHSDPEVLYATNIKLVEKIITSLENCNSKAHVLFSSSVQEAYDNPYGNSKKVGRELFIQWAERSGGQFTGLVIPNVFGPFGQPFYNSVVATFCHQLSTGEDPVVVNDKELNLIYV